MIGWGEFKLVWIFIGEAGSTIPQGLVLRDPTTSGPACQAPHTYRGDRSM